MRHLIFVDGRGAGGVVSCADGAAAELICCRRRAARPPPPPPMFSLSHWDTRCTATMTGPHPTLACEAVRLALSPFCSAILQHKHAIVLVAQLRG